MDCKLKYTQKKSRTTSESTHWFIIVLQALGQCTNMESVGKCGERKDIKPLCNSAMIHIAALT